MSKGSTRRPATVSPAAVRDAWDRTFRTPPTPAGLEAWMTEQENAALQRALDPPSSP